MGINKLIFEKKLFEIKIFAPNGKRKFEIGNIRPTTDKEFVVNSEHFEILSFRKFKNINKAKEYAQELFENWVEDFSVNDYKNEYLVE